MNRRQLTIHILLAFVLSVIIGVYFQNAPETTMIFVPLGTIYINLIKMIMVPLVFTSLVLGMSSISDLKKIGKMGVLTVSIFFVTTACAVIIGLALSNIFKPGLGMKIESIAYEATMFPDWVQTVTTIFPSNILESMLNANMLQIIFISIVVGMAIVIFHVFY